jgi:hypothetical protein
MVRGTPGGGNRRRGVVPRNRLMGLGGRGCSAQFAPLQNPIPTRHAHFRFTKGVR